MSQTRTGSVTNSTGQKKNGASASTDSRPAPNAMPARSPARGSGHAAREGGEDAVTRDGIRRPQSCIPSHLARSPNRTRARPRPVYLELLHPARIRVENLELDPRGVSHQLAARRHPPDDREYETAERVDVGFLLGLQAA